MRTLIGRLTTAVGLVLFAAVMQPGSALAGCSDEPRAGVNWSSCMKTRKMLRDMNLSGGTFRRTDFSRSDLLETRLSGADLFGATLTRVRLVKADLSGADLGKAEASRANFENANLSGAKLTKAEMPRANFAGADLTAADLSKTELGRVNFQKANLTDASLRFANVARVDFRDSNLAGVDFTGAYTYRTRLEGVDLTTATGLTQVQIDLACGDAATVLADGLTEPPSWPCVVDD